MSTSKAAGAAKGGRSLVEFVRDKRLEKCPVCKIPEDLRKEMVTAKEKRITPQFVVLWLKDDYGVNVTVEDLKSHGSGNHDDQLKKLMAKDGDM